MAELDNAALMSELNKLKKTDLIEVIINQTLSANVTSAVLLNFIERKESKKCELCLERLGKKSALSRNSDSHGSVQTVLQRANITESSKCRSMKMEISYLNKLCVQKDVVIKK